MTSSDALQQQISTKKGRNRLFSVSTKELASENYIGFILLDAYKKNPKKRQADFLTELFESRNPFDGKYGSLLGELNLTKKERDDFRGANPGGPTAHLPKTFSDKVQRWGVAGAIRHKVLKIDTKPGADAFKPFEKNLTGNLVDTFSRMKNHEGDIQRPSWVQENLPRLQRDLTVAGWHPVDLGIY